MNTREMTDKIKKQTHKFNRLWDHVAIRIIKHKQATRLNTAATKVQP